MGRGIETRRGTGWQFNKTSRRFLSNGSNSCFFFEFVGLNHGGISYDKIRGCQKYLVKILTTIPICDCYLPVAINFNSGCTSHRHLHQVSYQTNVSFCLDPHFFSFFSKVA
jgi:hypothetical protein